MASAYSQARPSLDFPSQRAVAGAPDFAVIAVAVASAVSLYADDELLLAATPGWESIGLARRSTAFVPQTYSADHQVHLQNFEHYILEALTVDPA